MPLVAARQGCHQPYVSDGSPASCTATLPASRRLYPPANGHRLAAIVLRFRVINGISFRAQVAHFRFSNRPVGVKRFQTIHHPLQYRCHSRARASLRNRHQGPSNMGFEDEMEQSLPRPCRQTNGRFKRKYGLTSSIVPRGTSFHRSVELRFPSIGLDPVWYSCRCGFSGPAEFGVVNPDAMHDHGQPARQSDDRLFCPAAPGDLHRSGLEPGPFLRIQRDLGRFVRGRDGRYRPPPAQNRASGIPARGSHLGCVTAKRICGHG